MSEYVTIAGLVQFDPRSRQAGGKPVRDVMIRNIGDNKNYGITMWPEKDHIIINKGDFVIIDGKLSQSVGQNKEGASVTYNNVSASTVFRFDGAGSNPSPATTPVGAPAATGDDFPF